MCTAHCRRHSAPNLASARLRVIAWGACNDNSCSQDNQSCYLLQSMEGVAMKKMLQTAPCLRTLQALTIAYARPINR